jgi:hypothetical protein
LCHSPLPYEHEHQEPYQGHNDGNPRTHSAIHGSTFQARFVILHRTTCYP